jgi:hypothetical protein
MRNRILWVTTALTGATVGRLVDVRAGGAGAGRRQKGAAADGDQYGCGHQGVEDAFKKSLELKNYTVPKKPWGEPDLSGVWLTATYTRLQRPQELGDKEFYTEAEAIAEYKKAAESDAEVDPRTVHYDWKEYAMDAWQGGATPNLRTSLIVDPKNGRLPPLTPEAQQRRAAAAAAAKQQDPMLGIKTFGNCTRGASSASARLPLVRGGMPGAGFRGGRSRRDRGGVLLPESRDT